MPPQAKSSNMQVTKAERKWILDRRQFDKNQRELQAFLNRESALKQVLGVFENNFKGNGEKPVVVRRKRRRKRVAQKKAE
jgi:hypothetical protein